MKKAIIILCSLAGVFIVLLVILRLSGVLLSFTIPTISMEPTVMRGDRIITSNLVKPQRNSLIVVERDAQDFELQMDPDRKKINYLSRLIAVGGDNLEIRNGLAYVNGQLADDSTQLTFQYTFANNHVAAIKEIMKIEDDDEYRGWVPGGDSTIISLSFAQYNEIKSIAEATRLRYHYDGGHTGLFMNDTTKKWSASDYGPITIPAGHYFLMGDNRYNAQDSRYLGFVPATSFKGTVLSQQ